MQVIRVSDFDSNEGGLELDLTIMDASADAGFSEDVGEGVDLVEGEAGCVTHCWRGLNCVLSRSDSVPNGAWLTLCRSRAPCWMRRVGKASGRW